MITQNLFYKKPKTLMDYAPGKVPRKEEWDKQTTTQTRTYDPFASNVKLVGDDITEKDYDTFFEGFKSTNDRSLWEAPKLRNEPKIPTLPKRSLTGTEPKRQTISYNPVFGSGTRKPDFPNIPSYGGGAKIQTSPYRPSTTNEANIQLLPGKPLIDGELKFQPLPYIPAKDGGTGLIKYASTAPQNVQVRNASQNSEETWWDKAWEGIKELWGYSLDGDLNSDEDKEVFVEGFTEQNQQPQNTSQNSDAVEFGEDSETYKILQDLSKRWYETSDPAEKDRLHGVAEEVRRLARGNNRVKYGTDEIFDVMHRNAEIGQLVKGVSLGTIPLKSALINPLLAGVSGNLLEPGTFLTAMALDKNQWNYKWNPDWQAPVTYTEEGGTIERYDGKDLDAYNQKNYIDWIYFDGYLIGADKFGNMNMAYVGKKMDLPEWFTKILKQWMIRKIYSGLTKEQAMQNQGGK